MGDTFLDKIYGEATQAETDAVYDAWATSYDTEVGENGYVTPGRLARLLFKHKPEPETPVLDYGCGTGLSGQALTKAGFQVIDGTDPNAEMLNGAREKGIYRTLNLLDLDRDPPIDAGAYDILTAIGVVGTGAAPPETFDVLMHALSTGGILAFSLNDHALKDARFEGKLCEWLDCGAAYLLAKEYGPHLPGQNLKSNVYIVEKK